MVVVEEKRVKTPFSTSCGCLTFMTSSSADLHSAESETSTTDPSSCTATTLTGTDTVLPVRMAVLRTSVSCMHTHTNKGWALRKHKTIRVLQGSARWTKTLPLTGAGAEERSFLAHTLWAPCSQWFNNFLSQKLHLDHQVLVLTNMGLLFLSPFTGLAAVAMKSVTQLRAKAHLQLGRTTVLFRYDLQRVSATLPTPLPQIMPVIWEVIIKHYNNSISSLLFQLRVLWADHFPFLGHKYMMRKTMDEVGY